MRVAVGCDHAGFDLKQQALQVLLETGHEAQDFGCHDSRAVDYPDVAQAVAEAVADGRFERGILFCGTGIGVSITANKVRGIRAALCHETFSAVASCEHNDSNVLCVGARVTGPGLAGEIVKTWLEAPFSGDARHVRRLEKIRQLECGL